MYVSYKVRFSLVCISLLLRTRTNIKTNFHPSSEALTLLSTHVFHSNSKPTSLHYTCFVIQIACLINQSQQCTYKKSWLLLLDRACRHWAQWISTCLILHEPTHKKNTHHQPSTPLTQNLIQSHLCLFRTPVPNHFYPVTFRALPSRNSGKNPI